MGNINLYNDKKKELKFQKVRLIKLALLLAFAIFIYLSANHSYLVNFTDTLK